MEITQDELDEIKKKMSKFAEDMRLDEYRRERDQREKAEGKVLLNRNQNQVREWQNHVENVNQSTGML